MAELVGRRVWEGDQDDSGYRDFKIVWRIRTTRTEGPASVLACPGLPIEGSPWIFDDDVESSIWCRPRMNVKQVVAVEGDPCLLWDLTQTFSNKPPPRDQQQGCQDQHPEDPLLEPQKVSGNFQKYQEEATYDRFGRAILTSSHEQIRGPQNEWDANRPSIQIVQNVLNLELELFSPMIDTVNMFPLWGLPPRCIKLSDVTWTKNYYGQCYAYYTRTLSFDINYNTFDRVVLDEGTKALHGHWEDEAWVLDDINDEPPSRFKPSHFDRFKDRNGENCRVILDGAGKPYIPYDEEEEFFWISWAIPVEDNEPTTFGPMPWGEAFDITSSSDAYLFGPYDTLEEATEAATSGDVGTPADVNPATNPGRVRIEKYFESDFLLLGIPSTF